MTCPCSAAGPYPTAQLASDCTALPENSDADRPALLDGILNGPATERVSTLRRELQDSMMDNASVFRTHDLLQKQVGILADLRERLKSIGVDDKGKLFNTELMEAVELGFLIDNAEAIVHAALNRTDHVVPTAAGLPGAR